MWNETLPEVRWVNRIKPIKGKPELGETILVLQQKQLDGWGNPYWKDVPIVEEETE